MAKSARFEVRGCVGSHSFPVRWFGVCDKERRDVVILDLRRSITDVEVTNPRRSTSHEPNEPPNRQTTEGV
jgi:hypothetical protein